MTKNENSTVNRSKNGLSRRQFLQATAATCFAASMMTACSGGDSQDDTFVPDNNELDFKEGTWHKSFCGSCIWANCGTEVKVQNGVAIELRGNKEHPANNGTLCPRGASMLMNLYNPYRLKTPLKRTNPNKGVDVDPGWVEITWEEAMNTVINRLQAIREPDLAPVGQDLRKLTWHWGFAANTHEGATVKLVAGGLFTPNIHTSAGPLCEVHHAPTMFNSTYVDRVDLGYCNYLVTFGRNIGGTVAHASGPSVAMIDAIERGMKIVSVDPHSGKDIGKGGEWVPVKPATDQAFGMAMLHVILHEEDVYDIDAMQWRSNAPYLIKDDGNYLRDADNKPMIWDSVDNTAKAYDDTTLTTPDFMYSGVVNGENVEAAFVKVKASVAAATPEWAEDITGVPAADIRRVTNEFIDASTVDRTTKTGQTITLDGVVFPYRPAALTVGRGAANNIQGQRFYVLANIINLTLGGMGVPGSVITASEPEYLFEDGMVRYHPIAAKTTEFDAAFRNRTNFNFTGQQFYPLAFFPINGVVMEAILDPAKYGLDYDLGAMFIYGSNPILNNACPETTIEAFKKIPFIFTVGYHMDETAMFCDIILPENSHYERTQVRTIDETMAVSKDNIQLRGIGYKEPAIDLVYNTRQFDDIVIDLASAFDRTAQLNMMYNGFYGMPAGLAMGAPVISASPNLDPGRKYTYKETLDALLKSYTQDSSKGTSWFKENSFFLRNTPLKQCYDYYAYQVQHAGEGAKGRLPMYNWADLAVGQAFSSYITTFNGGEVPGWEGRMNEIMYEFSPVPTWNDNSNASASGSAYQDSNDEFNMYAVNWKITIRNLGLGGQDDNVWLKEILEKHESDSNEYIQMHPETAADKGLKNGDTIRVISQTGGELTGKIRITNLIHKECLGFPAQGNRGGSMMNPIVKKGINYNTLLSNKEGWILPDAGAIPVSPRVKIEKA